MMQNPTTNTQPHLNASPNAGPKPGSQPGSQPAPQSTPNPATDVQVVQLILPGGTATPAPSAAQTAGASIASTNWWIPAIVAIVLAINALLIWARLSGRDPLRKAFLHAAARAGLTRAERRRIQQAAGPNTEPVSLLLCDSALTSDDPLIVNVRRKVLEAKR